MSLCPVRLEMSPQAETPERVSTLAETALGLSKFAREKGPPVWAKDYVMKWSCLVGK